MKARGMSATALKLLAVVLTRDGKIGQRPEGIVTVADTLEINNMLEAYL